MLHRPVRYHFLRQQTIVSGPGEQLQCDLVDCSEYWEANDGTRYLFCGIDLFSMYTWPQPLTSKRGTEAAGAMEAILDDMQDGPPLAVQIDKGTKMRAAPFQRLLKSRDIHFFTSENDDIKCAVVEHFQRTMQGMIHRHMTANRTRHLWTFCRPCCALITLHITAPLAWRRAPWTGPSRSKYGNAFTRRDVDLESVPPLQIGVIDDYLVRTGPKSGAESGGPLEFLIPASGDDNLDLSHCYLNLKCRVLKDDDTAIETLKTDNTVSEPVVPLSLQTVGQWPGWPPPVTPNPTGLTWRRCSAMVVMPRS